MKNYLRCRKAIWEKDRNRERKEDTYYELLFFVIAYTKYTSITSIHNIMCVIFKSTVPFDTRYLVILSLRVWGIIEIHRYTIYEGLKQLYVRSNNDAYDMLFSPIEFSLKR